MDYKEKYEQALERAKGLYSQHNVEWRDEDIEYIFPELKESEDERIKKEIITYLSTVEDKELIPYESWIAWLEKQGEQKPVEIINGNLKKWCHDDNIIFDAAKMIIEDSPRKSYGGVHKKEIIPWIEFLKDRIISLCALVEETNRKLKQKPVEWSEEDESRMDNLCHFLEEYGNQYYGHLTLQCTISWLKSLKDGVLPQPKQEWSEEDESMIKAVEALCDDRINTTKFQDVKEYAEEVKKWLKSLKDRVQPQPKQKWSKEDNQYLCGLIGLVEQSKAGLPITLKGKAADNCIDWLKSLRPQKQWKPSDEQMAVLNEVINYAANSELQHWSSFIYTLLKSLREQLKKLREE